MKNVRLISLAVILIMLTTLAACSNSASQDYITPPSTPNTSSLLKPEIPEPPPADNSVLPAQTVATVSPEQTKASVLPSKTSGQIYLYGEQHGVEKILDKEFQIWYDYYHDKNMRHLFIEHSYYTAEFLNLWMKSDNDNILNEVYNDWKGSAAYNASVKAFYKKIKSECPETIYHGTDVGHQYTTTGKRFLKYLENNGLITSEQYSLTQEAIEQGENFYGESSKKILKDFMKKSNDAYRENMMAQNFMREFDKLDGESIMGIYGGAHTGLDAMDFSNSVPCMAAQLKERYSNSIHSEDLTLLAKEIDPLRIDTINVNGKDYEALYFGQQDLTGLKDYRYREFWRLENAYDDFKDMPQANDVLPYNNYPMKIETGQVFVIDYSKKDGSVDRVYYRSDGLVWQGMPSTQVFTID